MGPTGLAVAIDILAPTAVGAMTLTNSSRIRG